ncbi:trehalose-phosphatase [soil metagenome]
MTAETGPPRAVRADAALAAAEPFLDRRPLLIVSDFDGTLSHISIDPWGASIVPLARRSLRLLAAMRNVHVAILSGRTAADVAGRARIGGVTYLGNHGMERGRLLRRQRADTLEVVVQQTPHHYGQAVEELARRMPELIPESWLVVERKTPAIAFHYRTAPDFEAAAEQVRAAVDQLDPSGEFVRFPGRRVLELRPPGVMAKGEAMRSLIDEQRPAAILMLGDDRSDALAFTVLTGARAAGETAGLAIAVQAHAEAPPEVARAADVLLASPVQAARFLSGLARRLARTAS